MTEPLSMKPLLGAATALSLTVSSLTLATVWPSAASAEIRAHALPKRGDHLPAELVKLGPNADVKAARLRRPPEGYGWFSLAGVFVLASVSNGLIVEVVAP